MLHKDGGGRNTGAVSNRLLCREDVAGGKRQLTNRRGCIKSYLDRLSGEQLFPYKHLASCPNKKFRHGTIMESTWVDVFKARAHSLPCQLLQVAEFRSWGNMNHTFNPAHASIIPNGLQKHILPSIHDKVLSRTPFSPAVPDTPAEHFTWQRERENNLIKARRNSCRAKKWKT